MFPPSRPAVGEKVDFLIFPPTHPVGVVEEEEEDEDEEEEEEKGI